MQVFYSYSHLDEALRDKLETHLATLKRNKIIAGWHDRAITAGSEWAKAIDHNLARADIILLLISADFLASDYCYDIELKQAMERHQTGEARVIPIILRPCDWQDTPFGQLQALPKNAKALTTWDNQDEAFLDVVGGIKKAIAALQASQTPVNLLQGSIYIDRPPIENQCYQEINRQGALLRLKAPEKMGKSLLIRKIFDYAQQKSYQTILLDLQLLETAVLQDSNSFLQWICRRVSKKLKVNDCVGDYWDGMTPNTHCTDYFEDYLLEKVENPLVLALDNIDRIFGEDLAEVASNVFGMLRSWWGFSQTTGGVWKKLRLVVAYKTEDLPTLDVYQSPFNVGLEIKLPEFNRPQVQEFAEKSGLALLNSQIEQLMAVVGGHPYLIQQAFQQLTAYPDIPLQTLLTKAPTDEGIYYHYLQNHWSILEKEKKLAEIFYNIVTTEEPIAIPPTPLYKLESMGLIRKDGNKVTPRYQLYRWYFRDRLPTLL